MTVRRDRLGERASRGEGERKKSSVRERERSGDGGERERERNGEEGIRRKDFFPQNFYRPNVLKLPSLAHKLKSTSFRSSNFCYN